MKAMKKLAAAMMGVCAAMIMTVSASAKTGTVNADVLNVRTAPTTDSEVVAKVYQGQNVNITYDAGNGWYEIFTDGSCYYVNGSYISTGSADDASYSNDDSSASYSYEEPAQEDPYANATYLGSFTLTAYCGCASCCGTAGNYTASGTWPEAGRTVAMAGVPFGTKLLINGQVYTVEDRGTSYGHVDIFMNSHQDAINFGLQYADVYQLN